MRVPIIYKVHVQMTHFQLITSWNTSLNGAHISWTVSLNGAHILWTVSAALVPNLNLYSKQNGNQLSVGYLIVNDLWRFNVTENAFEGVFFLTEKENIEKGTKLLVTFCFTFFLLTFIHFKMSLTLSPIIRLVCTIIRMWLTILLHKNKYYNA